MQCYNSIFFFQPVLKLDFFKYIMCGRFNDMPAEDFFMETARAFIPLAFLYFEGEPENRYIESPGKDACDALKFLYILENLNARFKTKLVEKVSPDWSYQKIAEKAGKTESLPSIKITGKSLQKHHSLILVCCLPVRSRGIQ